MNHDEVQALLTRAGGPFEMSNISIGEQQVRAWKHAPASLHDVLVTSLKYGDKDWIELNGETLSFNEHAAAVVRLANQLRQDGVKPGDRVAIVMRNLPEFSIAFFATTIVGGIATLLNGWWQEAELAYALNDSEPSVVIADPERWVRISEAVCALPTIVKSYVTRSSLSSAGKYVPLETVIGGASGSGEVDVGLRSFADLAESDDVAAILYTSGTTGTPKGAMITHRNICTVIFNIAYGGAAAAMRKTGALPETNSATQRKSLVSVPLFHGAGAFSVLVPALFRGAKLYLQDRWNVDQALDLIVRERINQFGGVPAIVLQTLEHPGLDRHDVSCVDSVSFGGAPATPDIVERIRQSFPNAVVGQGWGMTETTATSIAHSGQDYTENPLSCGWPLPVGDAMIADAQGNELPAGAEGELWYRGPNVAKGYWRNSKATKQTFVHGWVRTGDVARKDPLGRVYIVDRLKDMIIRGGENIYCVEVENALLQEGCVIEAAVVGRPHPTLGEVPVAFARIPDPDNAPSAPDLIARLQLKIAKFKVPELIYFVTEPLPRNEIGKINKNILRKMISF